MTQSHSIFNSNKQCIYNLPPFSTFSNLRPQFKGICAMAGYDEQFIAQVRVSREGCRCVAVTFVAVCCLAVPCVAVSLVAACCVAVALQFRLLQLVAVAGWRIVLRFFAACCSVLQRVAACCSVLQRVAASCSELQRAASLGWFILPVLHCGQPLNPKP